MRALVRGSVRIADVVLGRVGGGTRLARRPVDRWVRTTMLGDGMQPVAGVGVSG